MSPIRAADPGYIPFEPEAANLFFQLVSSRYERASLIVTSNKPSGRRGEVFGDDVAAAAMIDRLVHHAEVIALKGDSYRPCWLIRVHEARASSRRARWLVRVRSSGWPFHQAC